MSRIATRAAGEPVVVGPLPASCRAQYNGLTRWDGRRYTVGLDDDRESRALFRTLLHECGHLALRHIGKAAPSVDTSSWPAASRVWMAELCEDREQAADAWAAEQLVEIGPQVAADLAQLCAYGG